MQEKVLIKGHEAPEKLVPILDALWQKVETVSEVLEGWAGTPNFKLWLEDFSLKLDAGSFSEYLEGKKSLSLSAQSTASGQ